MVALCRGALGGPALVLLILMVMGCQQATSDPDAAVKALITSTTWKTDSVSYTSDTDEVFTFKADGSAYYDAGLHPGVWSYKAGVFTLTTSLGTFTTTSPDITSSHFSFNYASGLCHFIPLGS